MFLQVNGHFFAHFPPQENAKDSGSEIVWRWLKRRFVRAARRSWLETENLFASALSALGSSPAGLTWLDGGFSIQNAKCEVTEGVSTPDELDHRDNSILSK